MKMPPSGAPALFSTEGTGAGHPLVTVTIPVHNARDLTARCLERVVATREPRAVYQVFDDASQAATREWLKAYCREHDIRLFVLKENLGYTRICNKAIAKAETPYLILLNSDTWPSTGWIDRILACFAARPDAACVSPLSNRAAFQSFPELREEDGSWARNQSIQVSDTDRVAAWLAEQRSADPYPAVPFVNGFCLGLDVAKVRSLNGFDQKAFPRGYGEETDLGLRAVDAGYTNRIITDCFVYHAGTGSFEETEKEANKGAANKQLKRRHGAASFREANLAVETHDSLKRLRSNWPT